MTERALKYVRRTAVTLSLGAGLYGAARAVDTHQSVGNPNKIVPIVTGLSRASSDLATTTTESIYVNNNTSSIVTPKDPNPEAAKAELQKVKAKMEARHFDTGLVTSVIERLSTNSTSSSYQDELATLNTTAKGLARIGNRQAIIKSDASGEGIVSLVFGAVAAGVALGQIKPRGKRFIGRAQSEQV